MNRRTALIIAVPEAEPAVETIRMTHDWSAARGVPAHITILFPFVDRNDVDEASLAELFARRQPFDFVLDRVETGAGMTWLIPDPAEPFLDLTQIVWDRWPHHPPYEGVHTTLVPHLTVSETVIDIDIDLPIPSRAAEVTLIEEGPDGMWRTRSRFALDPTSRRSGS